MDILIVERNVFGNNLIYPVNAAAQTLAKLTGRKTLKIEDLRTAHALGHTISVEYAREFTRREIEAINAEDVL